MVHTNITKITGVHPPTRKRSQNVAQNTATSEAKSLYCLSIQKCSELEACLIPPLWELRKWGSPFTRQGDVVGWRVMEIISVPILLMGKLS